MFDLFSAALAFRGRIGRASYCGLTGFCIVALFASSVSVALTANYTSAALVNVIAVVVAGFWIILYYAVPFILVVLAIDPEGQGVALNCTALAIIVWSIVDLGIREAPSLGYAR